MSTRICLVGFGSAGDLHPLLALGESFRESGRPVTLMANPVYADAARDASLDFVPLGKSSHHDDTVSHPKLWHPVDGLGVMWRYLLRPALAQTYEEIERLARTQRCVVFASPIAMGARLAQEKLGVPLVSVYTAATMLRTVHHPMTLAQWRVPAWMPKALRRSAWSLLDRHKLEPLVRPALDPLRSRMGLPALVAPVFGEWMHSPQAGLALFPDWFASAPPDWPRQVETSGFALYDEPRASRPAESLRAFVEAGPAPVVFMPGTARRDATAFHLAALQACAEGGLRGVLLGPLDAQLAALPPAVHAEPYAPFAWLLPRARALVHHGGVGSCAQALRAGIPQVIVPQAYDQFDNAMRVERLGVGAMLGSADMRQMGRMLRTVLSDPQVAAQCRHWAARTTPDAARAAALRIAERLA